MSKTNRKEKQERGKRRRQEYTQHTTRKTGKQWHISISTNWKMNNKQKYKEKYEKCKKIKWLSV